MREWFIKQLKERNIKLVETGSLVENIIEVSIQSLVNRDLDMEEKVYESLVKPLIDIPRKSKVLLKGIGKICHITGLFFVSV